MTKVEKDLDNFRSPVGNKLPFLGQMVIVTTIDTKGIVNAAAKSEMMMAVTEPPIICFSCNYAHHTAHNILATHEFVVNIPGEDIIAQAMETAKEYPPGVNELEKAGLTAEPSSVVRPPRIKECPVSIECTEESIMDHDDEIIFFGNVVKLSIDERILTAAIEDRYAMIKPIATLGEYRYAAITDMKKMPKR
jgi:flavin reductase (DIM6/NTAB) family NADH-FMN oxidoreductase RutF